MQTQVVLAAGAEHDLKGIYRRRLAQRGPDGKDGAEALLARLIAEIERLVDFPESGPIPSELEELGIRIYRQLSLSPYRVIYLPERNDAGTSRVTILIVADGRRDFRTLLEERLLRG